MIEIKGLSKYFDGFCAVNDVNLAIGRGERFVLLGSSGSGKTTLLKMINLLIKPDSGSIFIDGVQNTRLKFEELRRSIGFTMQQSGLFPHLSVLQNVALLPKILGWSNLKVEKRARDLVELFGLSFDRLSGLRPAQLSGGQQQRIAIVRSLMISPPILLMDEPFGALDPINRSALRKEFGRLEELQDKTVLLVTHDVAEAFELGDRIGIMNKGVLLQVGSPLELIESPATDYVKDFFKGHLFSLSISKVLFKDLVPLLNASYWDFKESQKPATYQYSSKTLVSEVLEELVMHRTLSVIAKGFENNPLIINELSIFKALSEWRKH